MKQFSPPKNPFFRAVYLLVRLFLRHNVGAQSAALAFYLLFMLFPFLIFISALLGLLHLDVAGILQALSEFLPAAVVDFVKKSGSAQYDDDVMQEIEQHAAEKEKGAKGVGGSAPEDVDSEYDELIDAAAEVVVETGQASVSMLQRRLKLGYARAARIVDEMEEKGIVGPFQGSKPRAILITKEQWESMKNGQGEQLDFDDLDSVPDEES